jgi:hypothetical protein
VQDLQDTWKDLKITKEDRDLDAKQPYLQPQARPRTGAQGGAAAALVAMGAGALGIEGLSLGTKQREEVRTNSMGGSPRAEDDDSGRNPRSKVAARARSCRRRLRAGSGASLQGAGQHAGGGDLLFMGAHAQEAAPSWSPGLARHGHGAGPERTGLGGWNGPRCRPAGKL